MVRTVRTPIPHRVQLNREFPQPIHVLQYFLGTAPQGTPSKLVVLQAQTAIAQHRHNQVMPRREPKRNFETAEGYPRTTIRELVRQLQSQDQNNPERLIQSLRQDLASRKVHSRNEKKCVPAELETRKLEWEGRRVFRPIPYTAVKQEPRRSEQRMTGREQLVRLSGWENEQLKAPLWAGELDF